MKLRASEAAFVLICLAAVIASAAAVYISRSRADGSPLTVVSGSESEEDSEYDVLALNSASLEDFMQVSGIGKVKAGDIIAYRNALGGFTRASQLKDVSGISDGLYNRIIEYFYLCAPKEVEASFSETATVAAETEVTALNEAMKATESDAVTEAVTAERIMRDVNVNEASAEEISDALMIDFGLAEEIVALREKIHKISTVQELYGFCDGMTTEIYRRIKDYVRFD